MIGSQMGDAIAHRGPDDSGFWADGVVEVALVHRRLSVVDLSPTGHQPMVSGSGRFVIVFNGEIYNHLELRKKIAVFSAGANWRGHSDTETLLAAIDAWGLKSALQQASGMFAFALWDREACCLYLARDRLGEKPLYYGWLGSVFVFGSELKSLRMHPAFNGVINRDAIPLYLRHNYIPAPYTIYQDINKVLPGSFLQIRWTEGPACEVSQTYWSLKNAVDQGRDHPFLGDHKEAVGALTGLLRNSVRQQMVADVPLGSFLSGGVDSSLIVALMQEQSTRPIKTFTIGFQDKTYNEAKYAKAVAKHLGTEHTETYVCAADALNLIPKLPTLYDEPFADSSQIPTFLVSEMTRQHVKVSLSGDGGDELFGGYSRYLKTNQWDQRIRKIPGWVRYLTANSLLAVGSDGWDRTERLFASVKKNKSRGHNFANHIDKLSKVLSADSHAAFYRNFISHWLNPCDVVIGGKERPTFVTDPPLRVKMILEQMMIIDTLAYLPDNILVKVDRAAMGVGLETRVPLLDHRIVEFAWSIPLSMKIRHGQGKWLLRQMLKAYLPNSLIDRPKMGFAVPIDSWLRGPLRDWAESLLDESRLRQEGFFNPTPIRRKWAEHLSGQRNWKYHLWDVLMFQAWLEKEKTR